MSSNNSQFDQEIDAGKFFAGIFYVLLTIGVTGFLIWFYFNVYKPEEREYINGSKYAYTLLHQEMRRVYEKQGKVFDEKGRKDDAFCRELASKYSKGGVGNCVNINPLAAVENFVIKDKKISISGLEKKPFKEDGAWAKFDFRRKHR